MEFELQTEFIELYKLLKILNVSESGGQAKLFIDEGEVMLNGSLEKRRRAKIRKGDVINIFDLEILVK